MDKDTKYSSNLSFTGKDFNLFKFKLKQALQAKKLQYLLEVKPLAANEVDVEVPSTKTRVKVADWMQDDLKAQPILTIALSDENQRKVMNCNHLFDMMDVLENVYAKQSNIQKTTLLRSLSSLRMKDTDTMRGHVDAFMKIFQDLKSAGVNTDGEIYPCILILSVSLSWTEAAERIEYRLSGNSATFTLQAVSDTLIGEETIQNARAQDPIRESGGALRTFGNNNCFNCGSCGHMAKKCPTPKAKKPPGEKLQGEKPQGGHKKQWK